MWVLIPLPGVPPVPGVPDEGSIVGNKPDGFWPLVPVPLPVPGSGKFPIEEPPPLVDDPKPLFPEEPECPCPEVLVGVGVGVGVGVRDVGGAATTSTVALPVIEPVEVAPGAAAVAVAASVAVSPEGAELGTAICA